MALFGTVRGIDSIGEQGVGLEGGYPPLKKKIMTPPSLQNHPHPLRNGFWPPTPDFELFKLATFFFFLEKKKLKKNFWKKIFRRLAPAPVFDLRGRNQQ